MAQKRTAKPNGPSLLQRLVDFTEAGTAGQRSAQRRLLLDVLNSGAVVVLGAAAPKLRRWTPREIDSFRLEARHFLRGLVATRADRLLVLNRADDGADDHEPGAQLPRVVLKCLELAPTVGVSRIALTIESESAHDVLWFQIVELLRVVGIDRVRTCRDRNCARLFIKVGRREFCSDTCQGRILMRKRRKDGQDKARRRAP